MSELAPQVRWCAIEDGVIVLDIARGAYFALDPATSHDWKIFCEGGGKCRPAFLEAIRAQGWLSGPEPGPQPSRARIGSLARCSPYCLAFACLLLARWRLQRRGFADGYHWAQSWSGSNIRSRRPLDVDLHRFVAVEGWVPSVLGERDCLPRSLGLFVYLRALGHDVRHVIGVARFPFSAHAWVETGGEALLERVIEQKPLPGSRAPQGRTPIAIIV